MIDSIYQNRLRPFKVKGSTLSILFIIGKFGSVNQKTLSEKLGLDQSTISRDVKRLKERKLIKVQRGQDPRHSDWKLTSKGAIFLEKVSPVWQEVQDRVASLLGDFKIEQIDHITYAIENAISKMK